MLLRIFIKIFSLLAFILFVFNANATNYYLSNSGNDANTGTNPSAAWQTLNKLNSFKNLKPGDNVLFKRGDTFYGSITVNNSGTKENPITYGAYGTGENPVISGFTNVTNWTNLGNNIWESTDAVSTLPTCNMVVINGVNTAMGRWPNSGYLTFQSHSGKTSITSSSLTGIPNWTGAEVVIRSTQWTLERKKIASQSSSRLNYSEINYEPANGFGFFIQNDLRTLDEQDEWYYNSITKKLSIYSRNRPGKISVASKDTLVTIHGSYLNFNSLSFHGANQFALYNDWSGIRDISIDSCSISFSGIDAIKVAATLNLKINNSRISNSNNIGINLFYLNPFASIRNNEIENTGIFCGMGENLSGSYSAIFSNDNAAIIERNKIMNSGYIGIFATGDSFIIKNNYIDTFCTVLQDGGGIYTHSRQKINYGRKIINNIVFNGIGAVGGTNDIAYFAANGIYLDDNSANIEVFGNSVANCSNGGLFIHNGYNLNIHDNIFYNSSNQFITQNDINQYTLRGSTFKNNIYFCKSAKQFCGYFASTTNDFSLWGASDNNFYAKPINDSLVFNTRINWSNPYYLTLEGWKLYSRLDQNSKKSPKRITDTSDVRFEFNPDSVSKTILLPYNYISVTGKAYNGSITVGPYSSVILIKNDIITNQPPIANAGKDETIMFPVNSTTLSGSGSDEDGKIAAYSWTKISGPSNFNIVNSTSATTEVNGLTIGVYQFQLTVTDDKGASATSIMKITVNPAVNIPPKVSAGVNQTITLPVNNIILTGSASDADGQIANYLWENISGPSDYKIETPNSAVSKVSGLIEGVYQFQLTVKDDKGADAISTVQIIVHPALNIPPTANSGANQTITLPTNTVTLNGSGTDSDGTISFYSWTKISGPSAYNISNTSSVATTISGLIQGVYQFELTVTDDKGAVGKDTIQITVNPAANIPPTVNAGANQIITLPTNIVTLNGSGADSDGTIASYSWTKISGPSAYNISNSSSAATTISGLIQGVYEFELTVTDNDGANAKDTVKIIVNPKPNTPPTANAGSGQTITLPLNSVTLSGSGTNSDGTIKSYKWAIISGPNSGAINNANSASATANNLSEGVYQFELTVTDNQGATGKDTVKIIVSPKANTPPTANAGSGQTITLPVNTTTLNGSGTDSDGTISSYKWVKVSGPSSGTINNSNSASATARNLSEGVYLFELTVTDNQGAIGKDTVKVVVNPKPNIPPTANAGSEQTITLPVNTVTLNGSGTDSDGTITSYKWIKISGPTSQAINNANSASATAMNLSEGVYQFELTVTDNQGATGKYTVKVIVSPKANTPPTANAGGDLTVVLPVNTVYLNGSGNSADGIITAYQWKQIAGPDSASITSDHKPSTVVKNLVAGTYEFELTVTDNNEDTGRDTIKVVVALARISGEANSIKIYPNPVRDIATIEINSENLNSRLTVIISDFAGKIVYKKQMIPADYKTIEKINMSGYAKGSYTVSIFFDQKDKQVLTIIKQ